MKRMIRGGGTSRKEDFRKRLWGGEGGSESPQKAKTREEPVAMVTSSSAKLIRSGGKPKREGKEKGSELLVNTTCRGGIDWEEISTGGEGPFIKKIRREKKFWSRGVRAI